MKLIYGTIVVKKKKARAGKEGKVCKSMFNVQFNLPCGIFSSFDAGIANNLKLL